MKRGLAVAAFALAAVISLTPAGRAAELVTLRNGFQIHCDHYASSGSRVRLYLGAGEDNFIELPPAEIVTVAHVSDPVPAVDPEPVGHPATPDQLSPVSLTGADLAQMLAKAGKRHNLDVDLLASVVHAESGGNPRAVSPAGARGLMQLMPGTAASLGVQNSFKPQQNVSGGSAYLDQLLTRYGNNLALALAAYNAGPQAVDRYHGIPPYPETRAYVARVIHEFNRRVRARQAVLHRAASIPSRPGKSNPDISRQ
jgi:Transglycosylase SLT domain